MINLDYNMNAFFLRRLAAIIPLLLYIEIGRQLIKNAFIVPCHYAGFRYRS